MKLTKNGVFTTVTLNGVEIGTVVKLGSDWVSEAKGLGMTKRFYGNTRKSAAEQLLNNYNAEKAGY